MLDKFLNSRYLDYAIMITVAVAWLDIVYLTCLKDL